MIQVMNHMMDLLLDLSDWVQAAEIHINPRDESTSTSPSIQCITRRRVCCQSIPIRDQHVCSAAKRKVASRIRDLHLTDKMASDEGLNHDEDQYITHTCRPLKSGLIGTGVTMVLKNISWPHEVVYSSDGKHATYLELSVLAFVQRCLVVMSAQDTKTRDNMAHHLVDMMSDCDLYGWETVREFHGVLINQMEQGHLSWAESEQILKFHRALVWHSPSPAHAPSSAQSAPSYTS